MTGLFSALSRLCTQTDEDIMLRVKTEDDHEGFARLVKRWEEPIRRLCCRMTGDCHRAEDIKQETFVRLFAKRRDYQAIGRFSTYLWRIALNLCYDELRRQERRRQFLRDSVEASDAEGGIGESAVDESAGPDIQTVRSEESALVRAALLELPERYRAVVVLRHYEGLKLAEIAQVLDIPEGTVNSRMAEALSRLGRTLEPELRERPAPFAAPNPFIKQKPVL